MLNPKQVAELNFWGNLIKQEGSDGFLTRRRGDFYRHMNNFGGNANLSGYGIEVGTGCFSQLEWSNADKVVSIDPLNEEYKKITPIRNDRVSVRVLDGEALPETFLGVFDWVICWNVIDHTPNPEKMVSEIFRVLKPSGKLYFEVNFDDQLARPHYFLWNEEVINKYLPSQNQKFKRLIRNEEDHQSLFYSVYQKQ